MPPIDIPFLGNLVIAAVLLSAAYTFTVALGAGRGRPHMLVSARFGAYATTAFVALGVFLLAYAFQTHDFRIRYISRYSDRSMSPMYLVAALWGGQDGSLLWWTFLLGGYTAACVRWMKGRYIELQPWVIATLMSIFVFFSLMMLFAANPFATHAAAAPADGEGLNPLLQNYWMAIHPPTLYLGFVGWSVPFAFVIAALMTGRVHDEWILAVRKWALVAWLFLSVGLMLGMLWSYEELGWGGYWAWDPVENASFMPWLVATAYLHSVLVQERYGMLKVWNVFLMLLTFFMTIFGTFLTRSGLIASVHSFARSDIGIWFVYYMVMIVASSFLLVSWRLPELRARKLNANDFMAAFAFGAACGGLSGIALGALAGLALGAIVGLSCAAAVGLAKVLEIARKPKITGQQAPGFESMMSREFAFLLNNWILLGMMVFVLVATTFPLISEWLRGEEVTVGPPFYNKWMVPLGLVLLFLLGVGPLISWRKASGKNLVRAFTAPAIAAVVIGAAHAALGDAIGLPAWVDSEEIYETATGKVLQWIFGISPLLSSVFSAFVLTTIVQEFVRGVRVRTKKGEHPLVALASLVGRAKRRYGGYIVHVGMVLMYLGFTGAAYDVERETALRPGESIEVAGFEIRYDGPRMEVDRNKRMIFTDVTIFDEDGDQIGRAAPAKFIYRTHPEMPTTEVAIRSRPSRDLYLIMSTVDSDTKRATFRIVVRPLVFFIWLGGIVLIFGTVIAMMPSIRDLLGDGKKRNKPSAAKKAAVTTALLVVVLGALLGLWPQLASAQSDSSSSLHAGTVQIDDPQERKLFERLLCECGDCARLPLSTCSCGWAESKRAELRQRLAAGDGVLDIVASYRAQYGPAAISVPSDEGLDRALWAVPVAGIVIAAGAVVVLGRKFRKRAETVAETKTKEASARKVDALSDERYDRELEEELERLEGKR